MAELTYVILWNTLGWACRTMLLPLPYERKLEQLRKVYRRLEVTRVKNELGAAGVDPKLCAQV